MYDIKLYVYIYIYYYYYYFLQFRFHSVAVVEIYRQSLLIWVIDGDEKSVARLGPGTCRGGPPLSSEQEAGLNAELVCML